MFDFVTPPHYLYKSHPYPLYVQVSDKFHAEEPPVLAAEETGEPRACLETVVEIGDCTSLLTIRPQLSTLLGI